MKFVVTMKTPDALENAIRHAVMSEPDAQDADVDPEDSLVDQRVREVKEKCQKWFKYGETVNLEIDLAAETCVVVPRVGTRVFSAHSDRRLASSFPAIWTRRESPGHRADLQKEHYYRRLQDTLKAYQAARTERMNRLSLPGIAKFARQTRISIS